MAAIEDQKLMFHEQRFGDDGSSTAHDGSFVGDEKQNPIVLNLHTQQRIHPLVLSEQSNRQNVVWLMFRGNNYRY